MRSSLKVARLTNLMLAGMLTDNKFVSVMAVCSALGCISPMAGLRAKQVISRRLGRIIPFYIGSTIASFLPVLILQRKPGSAAFRFTLAGLVASLGAWSEPRAREAP